MDNLLEDSTGLGDHATETWNNKRRNQIESNWKYLKSKLVEFGFVHTKTDHGLEIFEGNSKAYVALIGCFDNVVAIKGQTQMQWRDSKIIVQLKGPNTYTAWCA